jgi:hypothetical protein
MEKERKERTNQQKKRKQTKVREEEPIYLCTRVYPKVSGLAAWSENCKMVKLSATKCSCIAIL